MDYIASFLNHIDLVAKKAQWQVTRVIKNMITLSSSKWQETRLVKNSSKSEKTSDKCIYEDDR